jgi:hypothetical protein
MTFRYSLMWAVVPVIILTVAVVRHRPYPMMMAWTAIILTVCLTPVWVWLLDEFTGRRALAKRRRINERSARAGRSDRTETARV